MKTRGRINLIITNKPTNHQNKYYREKIARLDINFTMDFARMIECTFPLQTAVMGIEGKGGV